MTSDGKHANSLPGAVQEGTPDRMKLDAKNENWRADVSLDGGKTTATWRPTEKKDGFDPARPGEACHVEIPSTGFRLVDEMDMKQIDPQQFLEQSKKASDALKVPQRIRLGSSS